MGLKWSGFFRFQENEKAKFVLRVNDSFGRKIARRLEADEWPSSLLGSSTVCPAARLR